MISLVILLLTFIVALLLFSRRNSGKNYPKGPFSLPLIGNLHQLARGHLQVLKWVEEYGDVVQIRLGLSRCYILSDPKMIREMFNDPKLSARPFNEFFAVTRNGMHGVASASGQEWMEQKRFTLRHLRDFGFGKNVGEGLILKEVQEAMETLGKEVGKPFNLSRTFNVAILNTLWMITAAERYKHDDPKLWSIFDLTNEMARKMNENSLLFICPSYTKLFPKLTGFDAIERLGVKVQTTALEYIEEHRQTLPEDGVPRDFIDSFLFEIDKTQDEKSSFYKDFGIKSLAANLVDFFIAGSDTTTATLLWCVLYMCHFPEAQRKLQAELDRVIGRNRYVTLAERPNLPYVEAVIVESTRYSSIVPTNLLHLATVDTKLGDYDVPKGTSIMANLYGVHHNERIFPQPKKFMPERFLSPDGKKFKRNDALMPFGAGKRACLGETLARDELFLFICSMFQRFTFKIAPESKDYPLDAKSGSFLVSVDFKVIMSERE